MVFVVSGLLLYGISPNDGRNTVLCYLFDYRQVNVMVIKTVLVKYISPVVGKKKLHCNSCFHCHQAGGCSLSAGVVQVVELLLFMSLVYFMFR